MKTLRIAIVVANKIEEMELIVPADLWRRAGIDVQIISVEKKKNIILQNGIKISCDDILAKENLTKYNAIYLPGGKGAEEYKLENCQKLITHLEKVVSNQSLYILSICSAPAILADLGLLANVKATCYPGYEDRIKNYVDADVVCDKNFITARGPAQAIEFALTVIEKLLSKDVAKEMAKKILYKGNLK